MDGGLIKSTDLITKNPLIILNSWVGGGGIWMVGGKDKCPGHLNSRNISNSWVGGGGFGRWVEKVDDGWLAQLQNSGQFNHKFEHQTIPQALYQIKS